MSTINEMVTRIRELVIQASNDTNVHDGDSPLGIANSDRVRIQDEINQLMDEIDATASRTEFNTRTLLDGSFAAREVTISEGSIEGVASWVSGLLDLNSNQRTFLTHLINNNAGNVSGLNLSMINQALSQAGLASINASGDLFDAGAFTVSQVTSAGVMNVLGITHIEGLTSNELASVNAVIGSITSGLREAFDATANEVDWDAFVYDLTYILSMVSGAATSGTQGWELLAGLLDVTSGAAGAANSADRAEAIIAIFADATSAREAMEAQFTDTAPRGLFTDEGVLGLANVGDFDTWFQARFSSNALSEGNLPNLIAGQGLSLSPAGVSTEIGTGVPLWFHVGANRNQGINVNIEAVGTAQLSRIGMDGAIVGEDGTVFSFARLRTTPSGNIIHPLGVPPTHDPEGGVLNASGQEIQNFIDAIDLALAHVTAERSKLGAVQNRLEYTIENLDIASENLSAANSRIRDADMAQEMMRLTQANVLQQAAISMLAQANQAPQSVLQLLG